MDRAVDPANEAAQKRIRKAEKGLPPLGRAIARDRSKTR